MDSFDYSSISTIDVKRNIYDLSINTYGSHIALVENQLAYDSVQESMVKIYAAGVRKSDEDEVIIILKFYLSLKKFNKILLGLIKKFLLFFRTMKMKNYKVKRIQDLIVIQAVVSNY